MTSEPLDLEPFYLYILSRLPVRRLEVFEAWREEAGSFEEIFLADERRLQEFGLGLELIIKLRQLKQEYIVEKLVRSVQENSVNVITYLDEAYPKLLKEIYDAPPVLFYRGTWSDANEPCVAIVGSRKMSAYGLAMIPKIAEPIINAGVTIVSGLAYGIDSAAHAESVKRGARTIAVLGTGVDDASVYPRGHLRLAHQILDNKGLLVSEQPPGTPGFKQNFIARNRIIAGLSLGVIIVECKTKSGALLTADYAADFNRNLYAVPGPAYSTLSEGPHQLIKDGAALITSGNDVLEDLSISLPNEVLANQQLYTELQKRMLECMQEQPVDISQLSSMLNLQSDEVSQAITMLELQGAIKDVGAGLYVKT